MELDHPALARIRVLFVDDVPYVLSVFRYGLGHMNNEWDMVFAASGEEALAHARSEPFDVVVSDWRMPGMKGDELLSHVQELRPDTVCFLLTGDSEARSLYYAVPTAYRIIAKPCGADRMKMFIREARGGGDPCRGHYSRWCAT
jgi:DNA-binding NtrC family response regulator